jgi:hypothetical protein
LVFLCLKYLQQLAIVFTVDNNLLEVCLVA